MEQMNQDLPKYTAAAQTIIYEPSRAEPILKMMNGVDGAIQAVQTVMSVIEQKKPIPPAVEIVLGPIILMLLVDLSKQAYGKTPNPKMLDAAIKQLMSATGQKNVQEPPAEEMAEPMQESAAQEQAEMPQGGLIQGAMQGALR